MLFLFSLSFHTLPTLRIIFIIKPKENIANANSNGLLKKAPLKMQIQNITIYLYSTYSQ